MEKPPPARRHPQVAHLDEIPAHAAAEGERFAYTTRRLASATGAQQIGCSWYEIPAGKTAFPFHFHCAKEESLFVLEGEGTLRLGEASVAVRAGDYAAFPIGPASAHAVINTGSAPLRLLCFSTMQTTELCGYPDSKKWGFSSVTMGPEGPKTLVREITMMGSQVGYFEGEDVDKKGPG